MSKENYQKIKLLKLYELLRQETDDQNPMNTNVIIARLAQMKISCERRTLAKDIALLNELGYEIMTCRNKNGKAYYIEDRSFSIPEIKILIDAVQAASFITKKKTTAMIDKIADLGGSHRADILKSNIVLFNTRKHSNESIFYNIGCLEDALLKKKKVVFRYFDLNERCEKIYRKDGNLYMVEPVGLIFNEDNYYLMTYSAKYGNSANYRVDKMDSVGIVFEDISEKAMELRNCVDRFTGQAFKMYGGQPIEVMLRFENKLIGVIFDKFGERVAIKRVDENTCEATVTVQISPTFWGWLFQFGKEMTILSPHYLLEEYKQQIANLKE